MFFVEERWLLNAGLGVIMGVRCSLVWDGRELTVPPEMGSPSSTQLRGSNLDNLVELAGRVCYDSLGKGRSSEEYHRHIAEVGHGSVWEHAVVTFELTRRHEPMTYDTLEELLLMHSLINRPGVWVEFEFYPGTGVDFDRPGLRVIWITLNLRAIREWHTWGPRHFKNGGVERLCYDLGAALRKAAVDFAPLVMRQPVVGHFQSIELPSCVTQAVNIRRKTENLTDSELWVSMFIHNVSRGLTHELVRHGDFTAISQRSTRYVDESQSAWCWHPLIHENMTEGLETALSETKRMCEDTYRSVVHLLEGNLQTRGADSSTRMKQARGAARGALGNALSTELIFSFSIAQFKRMARQRASEFADAEIRLLFNEMFEVLSVKFPERFVGWTKRPCWDGIGYSLKEK